MVTVLLRADDDAWRVSVTDITIDGSFTAFPGRHRLLTVVEGPVLELEVDGEIHVVEPHRPFALSGDAAVTASLPEGPVRVLDVVANASAGVEVFVTVLELGRTSDLPLAADQAAYVLKGSDAGGLVAGPGEVTGRCTLAVITLQRP